MSRKRLFDKKCVFCMWDNSLRDKEVFAADFLDDLMNYVEEGEVQHTVVESANPNYPFLEHDDSYRYCYYDPLYDVKRAYYKEGKAIQYWDWVQEVWVDVRREPFWNMRVEYYRIKPLEVQNELGN